MKTITTNLLERYNCGPVKLSGDHNAFYERHVAFDQVVAESGTTDRDKFEAIAHSVRDVLSQRWVKTEQTYNQRNAKRVYYLSMEFLLGRALANNISNLRLDLDARQFARHHFLKHATLASDKYHSQALPTLWFILSTVIIARLNLTLVGWHGDHPRYFRC